MRTRRRTALLIACSLVFGLGAALLLAEGVLRLLPVSELYLANQDITEENPILRFQRNGAFVTSVGPLLRLANTVRTNNDGFVNDQDYDRAATSPLLAVVGDSYVQAQTLPWAETLQGRLAASVGPAGRVYSFGASGAALSQYLAYARYARDAYHPDMLVVVVVGNDFDESLVEYNTTAGLHHFREDPDGALRLELTPWLLPRGGEGPWALARQLGLGRLALARYLRLNLPRLSWPPALLSGQGGQFVGNTSASADGRRVAQSLRAIDTFLALLPEMSGLPRGRVALVLDGIRPELYSPAGLARAKGSYFDLMRRGLLERARALGHPVADMQPVFERDHASHKAPFDYPGVDGHWNARANTLAAREVAKLEAFRALFPQAAPVPGP